jgi:hypothetical protein
LRHPFYGLTLTSEDRVRVAKEIYTLSTKTEGGFPHDQVYSMPVYKRYFYLKMLIEEKEAEAKVAKGLRDGPAPGSIVNKNFSKKR